MTAAQRGEFNPANYNDPMVSRILDAAEHCLRRYGIRRMSMGEVARVGKLSRGSIYRHFDDKEALVEGVFTRLQQDFLNRTEALLEKQPTLVDKLTESVVQGRRDIEEGLFASLAETEPETVAMMFLDPRFYQRSVAFWPPHIEMAKAQGEISAEVDIALATDFIMRFAVSLVIFPDMGKPLRTKRAVKAYLKRVVAQGLGE